MEVVKRGVIPGKELEVECERCKSVLRITDSDVLVFGQTIGGEKVHYCTCPVCGFKIFLPTCDTD